MQEDKESVFDAVDTVKMCLDVMIPMIATMSVRADNMRHAAQSGFINATDLADYLVKKGLPFRSAYKVAGQTVAYCIANGKVLETLTMEEYKSFHELFESDVFDAIDLDTCVNLRISEGGTSVASVEAQIKYLRALFD
jgi:argininosuccinate lyase